MKASQVLRLYAAGKRDFQGVNLRGQNLSGANLSGADFSNAKLYGTNFTGANLKGTDFTDAKCGLQRRGVIWLTFLSSSIAGISGFISIYVAAAFFTRLPYSSDLNTLIAVTVVLIVFVALSNIIVRQEIKETAAALTISILLVALGLGVIPGLLVSTLVGLMAGAMAVAVAGAIGIFVALALATLGIVIGVGYVLEELGMMTIALTIMGCLVIKGVYDGWIEIRGEPRDMWILPFIKAFAVTGGTNFYNANLTDANFTKATLKSTNFRKANITRVCFKDAKMIDLVFAGDTYLQYSQIRQWLIGKGKDKNFDGQKLRGINLQGNKNLQDASFIGADLSEANLQDTDLSRAKLVQTQLDGTDFTGATLTGAFIENWKITTTTKLNKVKCEEVFMRLPTEENPICRRKPDNEKDSFKGNDFADFIKPLVDTLDLYHTQGVDPRAIAISWKKLEENNPDANLQFTAMEVKGEKNLLLRLKTAPDADLSGLNAEYFDIYNQIKALMEEFKKFLVEKNPNIKAIENMINTGLKNSSVSIETYIHQGDNIMSNDRKNEISGIVNASGAGAFNSGDISGTVANNINQIPDSSEPNKPNIKQLLSRLKEAIETESHLEDFDKQDALEEVNNLAQASQKKIGNEQKNQAQKYLRNLARIAKALPAGAALVTICKEVLPIIAKFFE